MKKRIVFIAGIILIVAAAGIYHFHFRDNGEPDTIEVSGNIEVRDVRVSFKIPGRLQARLVDEGDMVMQGQLVAQLDQADQELALQQARAGVQYAQAVLAELETGSRFQEIANAKAELSRALAGLETARAQLDLAQTDNNRFSELYARGGISLRDQEVYQLQYEVSRNAYTEATARVESARQALSLVEEGARVEKREQAASQLKAAQENLRRAQLQVDYTRLYSPGNGMVLSKAAEPGEYLNPGSPVVSIGDLDNIWLRAYVNETDLGRIRLNQQANVTTDTYPGKVYSGRITYISSEAEFTPKTVQTRGERIKLMYRIKIALDNTGHELKPGMPADALIKIRE